MSYLLMMLIRINLGLITNINEEKKTNEEQTTNEKKHK